jgi:hypothetical protein
MRHLLFAVAALLAVPAIGCTAGGDDSSSSSSDVTLHPSAGGSVVLTLKAPPVLTNTPDARDYHYFYGSAKTEIVVNQPIRLPYAPDKNGKTPIRIEYRAPSGGGMALEVPLAIAKGPSTIELAAISAVHDAVSVDAGLIDLEGYAPDGKLTLSIDDEERSWETLPGTAAEGVLAHFSILPSFVGTYSWAYNGSTTVTTVDPRMVTSLFPGAAVLPFGHITMTPDANASSFPLAQQQAFDIRCPNGKGGSLALGADSTFFATEPVSCTWGFGAARADVALSPRATVSLEVKRLELDDVELTDEAGVKVPGTYEVFHGDVSVAKDLPTKTGLDLPPGHYKVVISYTTSNGPDSLTQEVDL